MSYCPSANACCAQTCSGVIQSAVAPVCDAGKIGMTVVAGKGVGSSLEWTLRLELAMGLLLGADKDDGCSIAGASN